jgi:hypothetical protein
MNMVSKHVRGTISDLPPPAAASDCFEPAEWALARQDHFSFELVRQALSGIGGSLPDTVVASREKRL